MARTRMVDGEVVPFTAEEEVERDAEEAAVAEAAAADLPFVYRRKRADAYKKLGVEPGFENAVGDILDAVIKHIYGDTAELDALAGEIAKIKTNNPKPV